MAIVSPHPLDDRDPDACDSVMRSERTLLITAKRESEDNLLKAIVQLASALIVLSAGFVSQAKTSFSVTEAYILVGTLVCLCGSISSALLEQRLSAKGYEQQIVAVTSYYTKQTDKLETPILNKWVERVMNLSFILFTIGLILVAVFAFGRSMEEKNGAAPSPQSTKPAQT
jgi:hypothetical protein